MYSHHTLDLAADASILRDRVPGQTVEHGVGFVVVLAEDAAVHVVNHPLHLRVGPVYLHAARRHLCAGGTEVNVEAPEPSALYNVGWCVDP